MDLSTPIREAGFVYRVKAAPLERLGIQTLSDLLMYAPYRYEDFTHSCKISDLVPLETSVIQGTVMDIKNEYTRRRFVLQKATIQDETGTLTALWFNQSYITRVIHAGDSVGLVGKLEISGRNPTFHVKDYEVLSSGTGIHTNGLVPVYSETHGISSKWIRNRVYDLLEKNKEEIKDYLPKEVLSRNKFPELYKAIRSIHFPQTLENAQEARSRLSFDELLLSQLAARKRREEWDRTRKGIPFQIKNFKLEIKNFIDALPFTLTSAQKKAIDELQKDLEKGIPMNRLLEGDVGSGKTVVAAVGVYIAYLNGYQSALMAPTEILAEQHYKTIQTMFEPLGIEVGLLTGSKKLSTLNSQVSILIGTHALIQKKVNFEKLGFVVIDEQQRFGVEQRAILRDKAKNPHFLTMTATPIPRTVLLTIYKDLDVSVLDEMPTGRIPIKTWLVPPVKREAAYEWVKKQIIDSNYENQAFIVCPFIEESESADTVKAAKTEFEGLAKEEYSDLKLGLLHGKMKGKEKNEILEKFRSGAINILVATPVVEVGIDIPNATIMIIEASDRFGLAQLHQLRGRVGRSIKQSFCLLFTESTNELTIKRLKNMELAKTGFELAELDLRLRGPGDMYGTRQHGVTGLKIADFSNFELVSAAKKESEKIFPELSSYNLLKAKVDETITQRITPD